MMPDFSVFIAYYGDSKNGTESKAEEVFNHINGVSLIGGKRIKPFFYPIVNPHGSFEETPMIAARTPLFLLVVDKNIPRNKAGQLHRRRKNGLLSNLYDEVESYHASAMYKFGEKNTSKLYITDDFDTIMAGQLHTIFSGTTVLRSIGDVEKWIVDFYKYGYPNALYLKCLYHSQSDKSTFFKGDWVEEAEFYWKFNKDERLARNLLVYYAEKYSKGDCWSKESLKSICEGLYKLETIDPKTQEMLHQIEQLINR